MLGLGKENGVTPSVVKLSGVSIAAGGKSKAKAVEPTMAPVFEMDTATLYSDPSSQGKFGTKIRSVERHVAGTIYDANFSSFTAFGVARGHCWVRQTGCTGS